MSRNAKITLTAEVRGFKTAVGDARKTLEGLGNVNLDSAAIKKLKESLGGELTKRAEDVRAKMEEITDELGNMAKAGSGAFDSQKAVEYTKALKGMKETLAEIKKTQDDLNKGGFENFIDRMKGGGNAPGMDKGGGAGSMMGKGLMKFAGPLLGALGIGAIFSRANQMADGNMKIRQLTRDAGTVGMGSKFGFTGEERRERGLGMAQAMGGGTGEDVTRLTDMGEQVERAYGIDQTQSAGFVSAARKAGVGNQEKAMSIAIGSAVAAGLEGSKIGDYLGAMTGYMDSLSQGVNIDQGSLTGFAGALSSLPFFKNDPNRSFSTIRSLDQTFKGGDAFQQAMGDRAMLATGGPMDAASLANRRAAGLFGNTLDEGTMKQLSAAGVNTKGLQTSGSDIINGMFKDTMQSTEGMSGDERLNAFRNRTGMDFGDSATLFGQLSSGKGPSKSMVKKFQEAQMSPEQRANETMKSLDGNIKSLNASIQQLFEAITIQLVPPLIKLANGLLGMFGSDTQSAIGGAADVGATAATAAGGIYAGSKVMAGAKGVGAFAGKMAPKTTAKLGAKLGGKAVARAVPFLGNLVNAGMTGWEAFQIAKTYMNGKDPTPADWGKLGFSAAGIAFPAAGLGAMAIEGAQAMGGLSTAQGDTPSASAPDLGGAGVMPYTGGTSGGGGGAGMGNDAATIQNTIATQRLTEVMMMQKGGSMKGGPSYIQPMGKTGTIGK